MTDTFNKMAAIQNLLAEHGCQALLLSKVSSFAWATNGAASYVNTATSDGAASLLITPRARYLLTTNIEATRLEKEEKLVQQGWELRAAPWWAGNDPVSELVGDLRLAADGPVAGALDLSGEIARLRANLTPDEGERFRSLGQLCAEAMDDAIRSVQPGMTEFEIDALLAAAAEKRGVQAIVNLIATDERIFSYRHPLPTARRLDRYAMLVLCGRKWGLVCSLTRLVYFGQLPEELRKKMHAVAQVDAAMIAATRPGVLLSKVFETAVNTYTSTGYPDEWKLHHQGGPAGYEPREFVATPSSSEIIQTGQVYAWNPSITGTKSEDTILIGPADNEIFTAIPGWPVIPVEINRKTILRPAILEID